MDIQEKKAFEIAFDNKLGARGCQFDLDEDGNYEDRETLCGWHMWLEAKAQAVPEGFVLVKTADIAKLAITISRIDLMTYSESRSDNEKLAWQNVAEKIEAMIEAQEPAND